MRIMKKGLAALLAMLLCLPLSGCQSKKGSEDFAAYTKELPALFMKYNSFDTNFLFNEPENYGIKKDLYTLDYVSLDDYKAYEKEMSDRLEELDEYDYDKLNEDQKITYDLLKKANEDDEMEAEDSYYLTLNYFDTNTGVQAQLPLSLWNYEFKNKKSVDSFIAILDQTPELFKKYTQLEKTRQDKGYGMSKTKMDDVIKAIHTINTTDQSYILTTALEQLDQVTFLSDEEKTSYKKQIKTAFEGNYTEAWKQTEKALKAIDIKTKGEGELSSYKNGKEYYEDIVTEAAGVETIEEYDKFLSDEEGKISMRLLALFQKYPELKEYITDTDKLNKAMQNTHYTDLDSADAVIEALEKEVAKGTDFPVIDKLNYQMREFPKSMKDTTLAAAAYFVSAYDGDTSHKERMILNGEFKQSNFTSIAHESFPGHMYQNNYFKSVDHDILRSLLGASAYSEGWATYIEDKACDYSEEPGICHLSNINSQLVYVYILQLDKKIHYEGMTRDEVYTYMKQNFGITKEKDLKEQYEQLLENPGVFANYYAGLYRILGLKADAEKAWGDDYSDLRFHKAILDLGPLPMDLLEKYMKLTKAE